MRTFGESLLAINVTFVIIVIIGCIFDSANAYLGIPYDHSHPSPIVMVMTMVIFLCILSANAFWVYRTMPPTVKENESVKYE